MREILFRAKRIDDGEWLQGHYVRQYGADMIYLPEGVDHEQGFDYYHIAPETVGQYTGLTDRNGKKIFEGDIVEYKEEYGEIEYHNQEAMFVVCFDTWLMDFDHCYGKELEIIGNIHDNPELLEGNK